MSDETTRTARDGAATEARPVDLDTERMEALSRDVLPALIARLGSSSLGELEVRSNGWRVRLRRAPRRTATAPASGGSSRDAIDGPAVARSPGVGYFSPGPNLEVGRTVSRGDRLGTVDVLGIEQEVVSPADGLVGRIDVEPGQAVEYGQELATISLAEDGLGEAGETDAPELEVAPGDGAAEAPVAD